MGKLFLLVIIFSAAYAKADTYHMACVSADLQSSIEISTIDNRMVFTYINNGGKKLFPLYSGVVTSQLLPHLKSAKSAFSDIGPKIEFSWPVEKCLVSDNSLYLIKCLNGSEVKVPPDTDLRANSFSTSIVQEQTFSFTYEKMNIRFILVKDNKNYEISIPFSKERCLVTYEK